MLSGIGNTLALTVLIGFINVAYTRPWIEDERALLLPGILGGVIGYAIGRQIGKEQRRYWKILIGSAIVAVFLSWIYNETFLQAEAEWYGYRLQLYLCFMLMNVAAFCVFGVVGWTFAEPGAKDNGGE